MSPSAYHHWQPDRAANPAQQSRCYTTWWDTIRDAAGRHGHVVDYRHVIHSLRCKPMVLLNLVYRDALFPRPAYRQAWERLLAGGDTRVACKTMVALLALAHERGCEAELAAELAEQMHHEQGIGTTSPFAVDLTALRVRFAASPGTLPEIVVHLPPVASYDALLPSMGAVA